MIDENPIRTARRLTRRGEQDRCLLCGREKCVQQHHIIGQNHDSELTTPACQGCHDVAHENLRRADVDLRRAPNSIERVKRAHKGLAVFLRMLADALERWNDWL
jgi:hypothetical protein